MIRRRLRAYLAFVRASFLKMLAYRLRYTTGVFSYLIYVATYFFLWKSVYAESGETIAGFDLPTLVSYVAVGWIGRSFYFNSIDREIADLVVEGEIAGTLARPISFQWMLVAGALGESLFRLVFFSLPIAVVLFLVFPIRLPATALDALAFGVSSLLSLLVFVHINFLVGLSALSLKSIQGILRAKHYLIELLSGLLLPITFFPEWLAVLTRWLPFQAIAYLPTSIYLGRFEGEELFQALGIQLGWALALAALSLAIWGRAARRLTIQGG